MYIERGGTLSWTINSVSNNVTTTQTEIPVRITQRHSWRRSYGQNHFCNKTTIASNGLIGEGALNTSIRGKNIPAMVECTDFSEQFDYSSGERSTSITLPLNSRIEYFYEGCCWIDLLPPDTNNGGAWSLKVVINTNRRRDGKLNNSPRSAMNPIVQVQLGKVHTIRIPMADSDGDVVRCRWGQMKDKECGSICSPKGPLRADPCELNYTANRLGYAAVALVIEDFDSDSKVLSSIPLQFLIHIVNETRKTNDSNICPQPSVYIGDRPQGACIGVQSNSTVTEKIKFRIPCVNTSTTLVNILTVSPSGMSKGPIVQHSSDPNLYSMEIQWTPRPDQYGIHQLCLTPVDSEQQTGSQICLTFQVDIQPPRLISMNPTGLVPNIQSIWTIETDRDIGSPRRSSGVNIRFFKRSNNVEVFRIDVASNSLVRYERRRITFYTTGQMWDEGEEYYILLDSGVAIINESCGIESAPITDTNVWTFQIIKQTTILPTASTNKLYPITTEKTTRTATQNMPENIVSTVKVGPGGIMSTAKMVPEGIVTTAKVLPEVAITTAKVIPEVAITTAKIVPENATSSTQTTTTSGTHIHPACCRWLQFGSISNETTNADNPIFTFCFTVNTTFADVTIAANTWVPCAKWKMSNAADPFMELYSENNRQLLAENDDGNSIPSLNCYASVLSCRLPRGDYRVIIRNPKCAYGYFELRVLAEIPGTQK